MPDPIPSTWVYLMRHGSVVGAETGRFIGHLDVRLSPVGEAEMGRPAARLAPPPPAGGGAGGPPPALREMAMGRWEGVTADEISAREPDAFKGWMARIGEFPFPEGESVADLLGRAWPAVGDIVGSHPA